MAEAEAGLVIPIGFTERAAAQAAARIEAQAIKAAKASEQAFVKANANIVKSTGAMSGQMRGQIQNVSYQLQDVFVQIAGGTDASRALSQQLPQLASGFGAVGAVIGTVLAVAIPLAAQFITLGDGTEELAKATSAAEKAQKEYMAAVEASNVPMVELIARYGEAAGAAREMLNALADIAKLKDLEAEKAAVSALQERFEGLRGTVETYYNTLKSSDPLIAAGAGQWVDELNGKFGLTLEAADEVLRILDQLNNTTDQNARNQLMAQMVTILKESADAGSDVTAEVIRLTEEAAKAGLALSEVDNADFSNAMAQVDALSARLGALIAQANSAAAALNASGVFVGSDGSIQTGARGRDPSTAWRFEDPNKDYDTIGERRAREAEAKARAEALAARRAAGGGGGKGAKKEKEPVDIFESAEREIQQLERQIAVLGKSSEETAKLEAQWAMLDAAKKAGIPVNDQLNAQIDAQAQQVGNLTAQLEQAQLAQEQFDQAIDGIANAFSNAILEGENLRDSLAQIFRQIAANILNAGIQQALTSAFSGMGGGGSWGGLLSAAFGGTKAAVPSFEGGGFTGYGPRVGGVDGIGGIPAIVHPNETIIDHTKGGAGGPKVTIINNAPGVQVQTEYATKDEVRLIVAQGVAGASRAQQDRQYLRNGR